MWVLEQLLAGDEQGRDLRIALLHFPPEHDVFDSVIQALFERRRRFPACLKSARPHTGVGWSQRAEVADAPRRPTVIAPPNEQRCRGCQWMPEESEHTKPARKTIN